MLMTGGQYTESLRKLNLDVYMFGKKIHNVVDDPVIRPSMNAVAKTYEMAHRPEYEDLMTARSHLTGRKINRFTHIHQSAADLVKKTKMGRLLGSHTGCCFQRCVGLDAMNALSIVTFDMDQAWHALLPTLSQVPGPCPGKRPHLRRGDDRPEGGQVSAAAAQAGPDMYIRVVRRGRTAWWFAAPRPTRPAR